MIFSFENIQEGSRSNIVFVFCDDEKHEVRVHTHNIALFDSYKYVFGVTQPATFSDHKSLNTPFTFTKLGVVLKQTSKSLHIASGCDRWEFPLHICKFRPGTDVWINVCKIH